MWQPRHTHRWLNLRQSSRLVHTKGGQNLWTRNMEWFWFLGVGGNRRQVWNWQTKFTHNHWLAALVKGKCSSTKPTHLATGVVCHPDTEPNRPYKIPWPCWELNQGPTALQAKALPVCHTTPQCNGGGVVLGVQPPPPHDQRGKVNPPGKLKKNGSNSPRIDIIFHLTPQPHFDLLGKKIINHTEYTMQTDVSQFLQGAA